MSTSIYGVAVKKFTDAGIHPKWLLPIAPVGAVISATGSLTDNVLGKAPGRFIPAKNVWTGLKGGAVVHGVSKDEFEIYRTWPTGNVGILGRAYPGIDSDAESVDAKNIVEAALDFGFGADACYGIRIRGKGTRRLYAFKAYDPKDENSWVRTRHITYKLKDGTVHKLDVIGYGGQYLIDGIHPSGDKYEWHSEWSLEAYAKQLLEIENADVERFLDAFYDLLDRAGGEIVKASGGSGGGDETDIRDLEPVMSPKAVFDGLAKMPNTPDTFLHRDDFVSALAAIRAALGKESCQRDVENSIFDWATKDPEWCDEAYFDKIWKSLDRVRVPRDSLDRLFRRNGVQTHVKHVFDDKAKDLSKDIGEEKKALADDRRDILEVAASRYLFGHVNSREGQSRVTMRDRWNVEREWGALEWWKYELAESDRALLAEIQAIDDYAGTKVGLANFTRDIQRFHPEVWYSGETRHPAYDKGDIVSEEQPDGNIKREINMRYVSAAVRHARKADPDPKRSQEDVRHILQFVRDLFGPMADYELDTLAFMAQTGDRPGSLLFIVGDHGVGKSIWLNMQMSLFDGDGPDRGIIDGAKFTNPDARRFILAKVEGCRILTIRELPKGTSPREMANITSQLKQIVDPGPEADYITVERKGEDAHPVRNHSRVMISSNYGDAIHIEQQDRRIFYVQCKITIEDKENGKYPEEYYAQLVDITQDPSRLAALWRYLKQRDIGNYTRYTAPPVSSEKAERIVAEITNAGDRHARAAIELFKLAGRQTFDSEDFAKVMSEMSQYEYINSGGVIDDRTTYKLADDKGKCPVPMMNALKSIKKSQALRLGKDLRTSTKRYPQVWVMADYGELSVKMMTWHRNDILDYLDADFKDHPTYGVLHIWQMYQNPALKKGQG
jgi:hypothetical protein